MVELGFGADPRLPSWHPAILQRVAPVCGVRLCFCAVARNHAGSTVRRHRAARVAGTRSSATFSVSLPCRGPPARWRYIDRMDILSIVIVAIVAVAAFVGGRYAEQLRLKRSRRTAEDEAARFAKRRSSPARKPRSGPRKSGSGRRRDEGRSSSAPNAGWKSAKRSSIASSIFWTRKRPSRRPARRRSPAGKRQPNRRSGSTPTACSRYSGSWSLSPA
jgi:hypothetical protein